MRQSIGCTADLRVDIVPINARLLRLQNRKTMGPFNNREIAAALWLAVLLAWSLPKAGVRRSLIVALKALLQEKVVAVLCAAAVYTAGAVIVLRRVGMWDGSLLKDTIAWFCLGGMAMVVRFVTSRDEEDILRKVVAESVTVVVVLEFLSNAYAFSLPTELVLVPVVALIAMVDALAGSSTEYSRVARITEGLQTLVGFAILTIAVTRAIGDLKTLGNLDTLRSVALAPLLSLIFIPFLYGLVLVCSYEEVFLRLDCGTEKNDELKRYARRRILGSVRLSLRRAHRLLRHHAADLVCIQTEADVDRIMEQAKAV